MDELDDFIAEELEQFRREAEEWGSVELLRAWWVLEAPTIDDLFGNAVLLEDDIETLKELLLRVRDEIKALKAAR